MPVKRPLKAAEFVRDLRAGLSPLGLMAKYGLNRKQYEATIQQLKDNGYLTLADLVQAQYIPTKKFDEVDLDLGFVRRFPRYAPGKVLITVQDPKDSQAAGKVLDLSEDGVRVEGIRGRIGQVKSLVLVPEKRLSIDPISFDGECRWIQRDKNTGKETAGFEIVMISEEDIVRLKRLMAILKTTGEPIET